MLASISSESHWHPFLFSKAASHHLSRHLRHFLHRALADILSAGYWQPFCQQRHFNLIMEENILSSWVRQHTSPKQAPEAISLASTGTNVLNRAQALPPQYGTGSYFLSWHWQPSPQQGAGTHLLSRHCQPSQQSTDILLLSLALPAISSAKHRHLFTS